MNRSVLACAIPALVSTLTVAVTPEQHARLVYIDSVDFAPFVKHAEKEMREAGLTPVLTAAQAVYGLKQYYALATVNAANDHAVSRQVDPYWHSHVLHTKAYAEFCEHGIGYFMHHDPLDPDNKPEVAAVDRLYDYTRGVLQMMFKGNVSREAWPKNAAICRHFGASAETMALLGRTSLFPRREQVLSFSGLPA